MTQYFIRSAKGEHGPVTIEKLKELVAAGRLKPQMELRTADSGDWFSAGKLKMLFDPGTAISPPPLVPRSPVIHRESVAAKLVDASVSPPAQQESSGHDQLQSRVRQLLTTGEEIACMVVQKKPVVNLNPDCVVLTDRRFLVVRPKLLGRLAFEDYIWRDLKNVTLREDIIGATMSFEVHSGQIASVSYLPKAEARHAYRVAQEAEERVREELRHRKMEETRAGASNLVVQTYAPGNSGSTSGVQTNGDEVAGRLAKLKQMSDAGLISEAEYEAKKREILKLL